MAIEITTEIAGHVRIGTMAVEAVAAETETRTMDAGIGTSAADVDRVKVRDKDRAAREIKTIVVRVVTTTTISSKAARCARRCYQSQLIQKV